MAILLKSGAVFLHIPKTGGSWVHKVLKEQNLIKIEFSHKHADMERVLNFPRFYTGGFIHQSWKLKTLHLHEEIKNAYKFCFVRHPLSWYESYWRFMTGLNWDKFHELEYKRKYLRGRVWHPNLVLENIGGPDFNQFIQNVIKEYPGYVTEFYGWYTLPFHINFIGKQENMKEDLIKVLTDLGEKFDKDKIYKVGKENQSKQQVQIPKWDENLKEEILKLEYAAFKRYGYQAR
ncbi:MAG: sulfotransferase family 2 domain-containing protein [Cyclobacteriaceae bacterium]